MADGRGEQLRAFLSRTGWAGASAETLGSDASRRVYHRVRDQVTGATAMVMDAPPEHGEDVRPFVKVASMLTRCGLSAPQIREADENAGLLLLEDFGDDVFSTMCSAHPERETEFYETAVDVLVRLHQFPPTGLKPYDHETCSIESRLFTSWYLPAATDRPVSTEAVEAFVSLVVDAFDSACNVKDADRVIMLRDYHAENIMWLSDREGERRAGLLDFQDAVAGHPAYDLVSLLEDARRDTSETLQEAMKTRFFTASFKARGENPDREARQAFEAAYAVLGAQRNLRILGVFSRLCMRDGKLGYLDLVPRVWKHLQRDLGHPVLGELAAWIEKMVPPPDEDVLERIRSGSRET